jgi:chromosome segregation ATPase
LGFVVGPSGASADSIDDKRRQAAAIADQLENLVDQMNALGENYSEALQTQADLSVEIERAQADVAAAEAQLAQMRGTLYMSAVTQFMHGGRNSTLTNLVCVIGWCARCFAAQSADFYCNEPRFSHN